MKKPTHNHSSKVGSISHTASGWSYKTPPTYFPSAVATNQGWCNPTTGEILVAISQLNTKNADATVVPTFTLTVPTDATYTTGQVLTFTLATSEGVTVTGSPAVLVTIGATQVRAEYNTSTSTPTSLKFDYTVVAGDVDSDGIVVANTLALAETGKGKTKIIDQITGTTGVNVSPVTFTVPTTTGILVNGV